MPGKPTYCVQVFVREGERIVPTRRIPVASEEEARAMAGALVPTVPAAAALCITLEPETGAVWMATILATWGEIPEGFAESLLDG